MTRRRAQFLFLYFLACSMLGWAYEVFLEVVVYRWGYSDRGVLTGPWCPVYGVGALLFLCCLGRLLRGKLPLLPRVLLVFLGCMLVATLLELATSYALEMLTGSWPWQTYRDYAINFEGRIALSPSVRFGLGGLVLLYLVLPGMEKLAARWSARTHTLVSAICAFVFCADLLYTLVLKRGG